MIRKLHFTAWRKRLKDELYDGIKGYRSLAVPFCTDNYGLFGVESRKRTWQKALSLGFKDLFLGQGYAIKLQTEQLSPEIASTSSDSTKSNRIFGRETYSSQSTRCYRIRIHPQRRDTRSFIISSTDVIPSSVFKPVASQWLGSSPIAVHKANE